MSEDKQKRPALTYVLAAAAATAAGAAFYAAASYVDWLRAVFGALGDDARPRFNMVRRGVGAFRRGLVIVQLAPDGQLP